ncbi:DUF5906 domain-containing protein [Lysobacter sp. S4-A87]|uniref:primase-helicase family protein n=1 Tax=Lysobacter sp. S4-A87 TaxID=2925843 RepID=UPI001F53B5A1|nr:primase-helicase family protein [Lysobacter sp. S4-A87]UNK50553.1 DUF5906 domain-containing protein [Lysobacter sp. S4-A87]
MSDHDSVNEARRRLDEAAHRAVYGDAHPTAPPPLPPPDLAGAGLAAMLAAGEAHRLMSMTVPERGLRFVVGIKNEIPWRTRVGTNAEVISIGQQYDAGGRDVYFAVAGYRLANHPVNPTTGKGGGPSREGKNAIWHRCLRMELDVVVPGEPRKAHHHGSKAAARQALDAFVTLHALPAPIIVDSGGGLHAYWPFDRDVAVTQWQPLADRLKALAGNLVGSESTADAARILRLPDTHNFKPHFGAGGRVVTVVNWGDGATAPEAIAQMLGMQLSAACDDAADDDDDLDEQIGLLRGASVPGVLDAGDGGSLQTGVSDGGEWGRWLLSLGDDDAVLAMIDSMAPYFIKRFFSGDKGDCARDDWMLAVFAFRNLTKARPSAHDALKQRALDWSRASPQWKRDPKSAREQFEEFWLNAISATLTRLAEHAIAQGWKPKMATEIALPTNASADHSPAPVPMPPPVARYPSKKAFRAALADRYTYVQASNEFLKHENGQLHPAKAVALMEQCRAPFKGKDEADDKLDGKVESILRFNGKIRRVDVAVYMPGYPLHFLLDDGRSAVNTYRFTPPPSLPAEASEAALLQELLEHTLPSRDTDCAVWRERFLDSLTWLVQDERHRLPYATVLLGTQGCGKSTLLDKLVRLALGNRHVGSVSIGEFNSQFTGWATGVRAVAAADIRANTGGRGQDASLTYDMLKPLITDPITREHRKTKDGYDVPNTVSLFVTSNRDDALHLDEDDRRMMVARSPAGRMPDELGRRLYRWLDGPRAAGVLRGWLLARDTSRFNPHALPPMTQAKRRMTALSRSEVARALVDRFEQRAFPFDLAVITTTDCLEALGEDGFELREVSARAVAAVLLAPPISAETIGKLRVQPRGIDPPEAGEARKISPVRGYVPQRDDPAWWTGVDEGFVRQLRRSKR